MANTGITTPEHMQPMKPRVKAFHSGEFSFSSLHIGLGPPFVAAEIF
jgi:hypothetical protein